MTDYPLASKALPMRLMCRNWPSRSACNSPSMLFLVALRENVSIPPAYHIPLDTLFQCVSRDGNSKSCTGIQRWLLSFHVGKQVSNKTSVFCEGDHGNVLIPSNRATKETGNQHENFRKRTSLLKNSIAELYEVEKHRKSLSYSAKSQYFGSQTWYFVFLKTHQLSFSTGCTVF